MATTPTPTPDQQLAVLAGMHGSPHRSLTGIQHCILELERCTQTGHDSAGGRIANLPQVVLAAVANLDGFAANHAGYDPESYLSSRCRLARLLDPYVERDPVAIAAVIEAAQHQQAQ